MSRAVVGDYPEKLPVGKNEAENHLYDELQSAFSQLRKYEAELRRYRVVYDSIHANKAVIEFDLDGTIQDANDNFLRTTGYTLPEIKGRHHRIFAGSEYADSQEYRDFWARLASGEGFSGEFKRFAKGGREIWINATYQALLDDHGKPYRIIKIGSDVTEILKKRDAELGRMSAMLEASAPMVFADTDKIIRYMNPEALSTLEQFEEYLPIKAKDIVGQSFDIFHSTPAKQRNLVSDAGNLPLRTRIPLGPETLELNVKAVFGEDQERLGSMVTWELVTEKLRLEREVKQNAERQEREAQETNEKVESVLKVVNQIAEGRFDIDLPDVGDDAIGKVAKALTRAVESVRDAIGNVREVSSLVAEASTEMTNATSEISRGAQDQACRLEETASSLEEITLTVQQNSESALTARSLADSSRNIASEGGKVVGDAVQAMQEINESSKQISDIITTIDEIAFQTNLLALNAAVEAARAGEQGRGFAVVASEVRNLAQRSASSAKEIKLLIQDSTSKVERGTKLVYKSGETLEEIVSSVKQVTDFVAEIATASVEQLTAIKQVNGSVSKMDEVTQANANQTEELAGTSSSVLQHANHLYELVRKFELGNHVASITKSAVVNSVSRHTPAPKSNGATNEEKKLVDEFDWDMD
ncbi:methyl-accepting chemotaxis protein [Stieleria sp. JC731]|uniref:methyl-accepting chemotaxis protein n=1 Tax=Stieleria sp. JC731 TaxID=2894195 RepID=UPI001E418C6D|nr:methyl-accepting chemotaxis protein [Stieleria sp. JC731]MCC9601684.1 methyl-accepting chemotaxis protein [Stieleria sp. JC731]